MEDSQARTAEGLDEAVLLSVLTDVKNGDFAARMPGGWVPSPAARRRAPELVP